MCASHPSRPPASVRRRARKQRRAPACGRLPDEPDQRGSFGCGFGGSTRWVRRLSVPSRCARIARTPDISSPNRLRAPPASGPGFRAASSRSLSTRSSRALSSFAQTRLASRRAGDALCSSPDQRCTRIAPLIRGDFRARGVACSIESNLEFVAALARRSSRPILKKKIHHPGGTVLRRVRAESSVRTGSATIRGTFDASAADREIADALRQLLKHGRFRSVYR